VGLELAGVAVAVKEGVRAVCDGVKEEGELAVVSGEELGERERDEYEAADRAVADEFEAVERYAEGFASDTGKGKELAEGNGRYAE
jgi:hypothetical protein